MSPRHGCPVIGPWKCLFSANLGIRNSHTHTRTRARTHNTTYPSLLPASSTTAFPGTPAADEEAARMLGQCPWLRSRPSSPWPCLATVAQPFTNFSLAVDRSFQGLPCLASASATRRDAPTLHQKTLSPRKCRNVAMSPCRQLRSAAAVLHMCIDACIRLHPPP